MKRQNGTALLLLLIVLGAVGAFFALKALNSGQAQRDQATAQTLAQAKEALIGFAATYRDQHANQVFGFLPCPDTDNNGIINAPCGAVDVSATGRLPWSTLRLPALRDSSGECLWYAVSGTAKDNPPTITAFNWDTPGQFTVQDAAGNTLAGASPHDRPWAILFAPHTVLGTQTRPSTAGTECPGSNVLNAYLENTGTPNTFVLSTPDSIRNATNNDQGTWITSKDVFDRVMRRSDFKADIDNMVGDLADYLNNLPQASLPAASGSKGTTALIAAYLAANPGLSPQKTNVLANWSDNLLYTGPITASVNGTAGCHAVLLFGGARQGTQNRATVPERAAAANYLEGANATLFPGNGAYTGLQTFNANSASSDIARCINNQPVSQFSFANNFSSFNTSGSGVTTDAASHSVTIATGSATSGGCFWFSNPAPLAGKTLRVYYDFLFGSSDTHALTGSGTDRGYGFSLQMVHSDFSAPPTGCGATSNMGVLTAGTPYGYDPHGDNSVFGQHSFIFETDVYRNTTHSDPVENHTAIMLNGTLNHALSGTLSAACNGTAGGCRHTPANKFEESPVQNHNQRIEITTGCNAACTACDPSNHVAPNTYARITVWVDCSQCSDVTANLDRVAQPPAVQRCTALTGELNSVYFGLTGGFRSGAGSQSVMLRNFILRTE